MKLGRVRPWDWVAAALGALLIVMLGRDWYELPEGGASGWSVFGVLDVLLLLAGLSAILVPLVAARCTAPALPVAVTVASTAITFLLIPFVAYRLADQPGRNADVSVALGGWIGALCLPALLYALYRAVRDQRMPGVPPAPTPERMAPPKAVEPAHEPPAPSV